MKPETEDTTIEDMPAHVTRVDKQNGRFPRVNNIKYMNLLVLKPPTAIKFIKDNLFNDPTIREILGLCPENVAIMDMPVGSDKCVDPGAVLATYTHRQQEPAFGKKGGEEKDILVKLTARMLAPFAVREDDNPVIGSDTDCMLNTEVVQVWASTINLARPECLVLSVGLYTKYTQSKSYREFEILCDRYMVAKKTELRTCTFDLAGAHNILIPIYDKKEVHFTLLVAQVGVCGSDSSLVYLDSNRAKGREMSGRAKTFAEYIGKYLRHVGESCEGQEKLTESIWEVEAKDVGVQADAWSCGYHMLMFMDMISRNIKVESFSEYYNARQDMHRMRKYYGMMLLLAHST